MARRSAAERLKAAQDAVELAEVRVSKAKEKARLARCRVEKLAARTEQTERRQDTRRKILLGASVLIGVAANVEVGEAVIAALLPFMRPHDRDLVQSISIGDSYRRDTQRKAALGGALIAAARQDAAEFGELLAGLADPTNFRAADRALFEGWTP